MTTQDTVSATVRAAMAVQRYTSGDVGKYLDMHPATVRSRLDGSSAWRLHEVDGLAELLQIPVVDLVLGTADLATLAGEPASDV